MTPLSETRTPPTAPDFEDCGTTVVASRPGAIVIDRSPRPMAVESLLNVETLPEYRSEMVGVVICPAPAAPAEIVRQ